MSAAVADAEGGTRRHPVPMLVAAAVLPLVVLALLMGRPEADATWENHPAHFWLVLTTALAQRRPRLRRQRRGAAAARRAALPRLARVHDGRSLPRPARARDARRPARQERGLRAGDASRAGDRRRLGGRLRGRAVAADVDARDRADVAPARAPRRSPSSSGASSRSRGCRRSTSRSPSRSWTAGSCRSAVAGGVALRRGRGSATGGSTAARRAGCCSRSRSRSSCSPTPCSSSLGQELAAPLVGVAPADAVVVRGDRLCGAPGRVARGALQRALPRPDAGRRARREHPVRRPAGLHAASPSGRRRPRSRRC